MEAELRRLSARVAEARGAGAALCAALRPFVRAAEAELRAVRAERERMCGAAAAALDFYCEEAAPGALRELCAVLHGFAGRFLSAVQVTQPGPPSRRLSPPRSALTPSPRRRTAPGSSPSAGGSSSSCSGTSGAPSPRVRCGTRSPTDPADPSATLRRCSGGIRPRRSPSCGATPDPRGPRRSPPLRLPPPPRPPPASPRCSLDGGPAALPPRRRAAPRCSAFCGAWRAGRRAEPPRAESRRVLSSPVLLCDDNKCFGPPPGCGTYSAGSEVRDAGFRGADCAVAPTAPTHPNPLPETVPCPPPSSPAPVAQLCAHHCALCCPCAVLGRDGTPPSPPPPFASLLPGCKGPRSVGCGGHPGLSCTGDGGSGTGGVRGGAWAGCGGFCVPERSTVGSAVGSDQAANGFIQQSSRLVLNTPAQRETALPVGNLGVGESLSLDGA